MTKQEFIEVFELKEGDYVEFENGYLHLREPIECEMRPVTTSPWITRVMIGFKQCCNYPIICLTKGNRLESQAFARPVVKPPIVPWTWQDLMENLDGWFSYEESESIYKVEKFNAEYKEIYVDRNEYSFDEFVETFRLYNPVTGERQKLEKEAK